MKIIYKKAGITSVAAVVFLTAVFSTAAEASGKVLLVHSYHAGYPWVDSISRGVKKALAGTDIQLEYFYMDTKRRPDEEWKIKSGEMALEKTAVYQPDVVIAADDNAQEYFAKKLAGKDKPQIVFCGVNSEASKYGYPASNVTGILERPFVVQTMNLLKSIAPAVRRVAVISDKGETTDGVFEYIRTIKTAPLEIVALEEAETFADWQKLIEKYQTDADAIIFNTYHTIKKDRERVSMDPKEIMTWTLAHNKIPTAGFLEFNIDEGILCGVAESGEEHGRQAGEIAVKIVGGKTAKDFPIKTTGKGLTMINLAAARDLGLMPAESVMSSADRIVTDFNTDARVTLSAIVGLADEHVNGVLYGLKLLAASAPVSGGDWENMRSLVSKFAENVPGVVWFGLPDGSYYTADKGLMDKKLNDRDYFSRLMAGETVIGELLVSRSTGKKSMVIGVPVKKDGKIVGAIGASLFLEKMTGMIDEKLGLPENMLFYALDPKGRVALHRDPDLMLDFASELGSETLTRAVKEMLARPEGAVMYEFNGMAKTVLYRESPLTGWRFALGVQVPVAERKEIPPDVSAVLLKLKETTASVLNKMDSDVALAAKELVKTGLTGPGARRIISRLCLAYPETTTDCAAVDDKGIMVSIEPAGYGNLEGSDISAQEQVVRLQKTKKPVLSAVFRSVEGINAVDLEYPVFSDEGKLEGSLSMLIRPEFVLSDVVASVIDRSPVDAWVIQKDGLILYDREKQEIGRNIFSDPIYKPFPQLRALTRRIAEEDSGSGVYEYPFENSGRPVKKQAYWTTVELHGAQWRLVVINVIKEKSAVPQ